MMRRDELNKLSLNREVMNWLKMSIYNTNSPGVFLLNFKTRFYKQGDELNLLPQLWGEELTQNWFHVLPEFSRRKVNPIYLKRNG